MDNASFLNFGFRPYFSINEYVDDVRLRHKIFNIDDRTSRVVLKSYREALEKLVTNRKQQTMQLYRLKTRNNKTTSFVKCKTAPLEDIYLEPESVITFVENTWPVDFNYWPSPEIWLTYAFNGAPLNLDDNADYRPWQEHLAKNLSLPIDDCICYAMDGRLSDSSCRDPSHSLHDRALWKSDEFSRLENLIKGMIDIGEISLTKSGRILPFDFREAALDLGFTGNSRQFLAEWILPLEPEKEEPLTGREKGTAANEKKYKKGRDMATEIYLANKDDYSSRTNAAEMISKELKLKHSKAESPDWFYPAERRLIEHFKDYE